MNHHSRLAALIEEHNRLVSMIDEHFAGIDTAVEFPGVVSLRASLIRSGAVIDADSWLADEGEFGAAFDSAEDLAAALVTIQPQSSSSRGATVQTAAA